MCKALNNIENFLILNSDVSGYVSISVFASIVGVPVKIRSSTVALKICALTARIQKYKLIINKKVKNLHKMLLLANIKPNTIGRTNKVT